jgi:hypothetical protein
MARTYLVFGDIESKLDVLRVECTKCECRSRYSVAGLIEMAQPTQWRLPEAGSVAVARLLRPSLPRSAEGAVASFLLAPRGCKLNRDEPPGGAKGGLMQRSKTLPANHLVGEH